MRPRPATLPLALAVVLASGARQAHAQHLVDLSYQPSIQAVVAGDEVRLEFFAASDGAAGQPFSAVEAILDWDPAVLQLLGFDNTTAGYSWFLSGFLPDPDGINASTSDGDALFTALSSAGTPAVAPPVVGLRVTTFRFLALAPSTGTVVAFTPTLGQFGKTRVLDYFSPGLEITGDISSTAAIAVVSAPTFYCTSKPTSIPGCVPTLSTTGTPSVSAGSGFVVHADPVPGQNTGAFVYTTGGPALPPFLGPYGYLCISPGPGFFRIAPQAGSGTTNVCNGDYDLDFNLFVATQTADPNLVVGAQVDLQCWYRDPPNSGNANLTNAVQFVLGP